MDIKQQVTKWVEKKIGKLISNDLKEIIQEENSYLDVEAYVNNLYEKHFKDAEIENMKKKIENECFQSSIYNYYSDSSTEGETSSNASLEFEVQEFNSLSTDEIISQLLSNSRELKIRSLQSLEASAEDMNQISWNVIKKTLQNLLERKEDKKIQILILKVFQKLMMCPNKPQFVCDAFITVAEIISFNIEMVNTDGGNISFEEMYDLKENKWLYKKTPSIGQKPVSAILPSREQRVVDSEVLIKSMWLLIECQKQMPEKWIRFSENRLREIIFSFIHLLSSTTNPENEKLSGLDLVSVLNPTSTWSRHWCHTAIGRSLLCLAFRKYRNFFVVIIEIILSNMKVKKTRKLKSLQDDNSINKIENESGVKSNNFSHKLSSVHSSEKENELIDEKYVENDKIILHSAPNTPIKKTTSNPSGKLEKSQKISSSWFIKEIPSNVVTQATFCHCMSLVVYLIQFRSGRSLFPIQTTSRKRLLSVQDLVLSMIDYLQNFEQFESKIKGVTFLQGYRKQVTEMICILKDVESTIHSSRLSAERIQLSQR